MPIERRPSNPLPADYVPAGGIPYKVKTNDDLGSVARKHGVPEERLVSFNFATNDPAEINWYLRRNVGCVRPTHDHKNWMFTSEASPGIIYIPPAWQRPSFPATTPTF
jgi:spore germination protein YaaH